MNTQDELVDGKQWHSRSFRLKGGEYVELVYYSTDGINCNKRKAYLIGNNGEMVEDLTSHMCAVKAGVSTSHILASLNGYLNRRRKLS